MQSLTQKTAVAAEGLVMVLPGKGDLDLPGVAFGTHMPCCWVLPYLHDLSTDVSLASVTLASALQVRGEALSEEEIWSLLSLAGERLLEDLRSDSSDYVVCPWSALLSAAGSLSFQDHVSHLEAAPFKAPELLQGQSEAEHLDASQMHVYSLGMTLYWAAGFRVPLSQPLWLRQPLHTLLLAMCEDQPHKRCPLHAVLEACQAHQEEVAASSVLASLHVRRLVGLVLGTISEVERRVVQEDVCTQQSRSYLLRKRLQPQSSEGSEPQAVAQPQPHTGQSREMQSSWEPRWSSSAHSHCNLLENSALAGAALLDGQDGQRLSSGSTLLAEAESSRSAPPQQGFLQRKGKFSRPEFHLLAAEAPVTLHLPGSVVTKKGRSYLALRDVCVVLLSGQGLEVKCDIESTVGAVFDVVTSFANLGDATYFSLAYVKGKEFFFLENETRLCKIAPEGWREQPLKTALVTFTLFLRIKFFVSNCGLLKHSTTRHQFYLQLRKDILEERLLCDDETLLQLGVLALQAEFGSYPKEQAESKPYFLVEDYLPATLIKRMTALRAQAEISEMHQNSSALWGEDAELEFLRVTQQLLEYGVLIHQVFPEKKRLEGEMALGVCAKGVIIYEVKNCSRIAILWFPWREIGKISTYRKKFTITSSLTGKKHTFITDSAKTCTYLLGLCSAQHGFHAQAGSGPPPRLLTGQGKVVQTASLSPAHQAPSKPLSWSQRLSCSENELFVPKAQDAVGGLLSMSLENCSADGKKESRVEAVRSSPCTGQEHQDGGCLIQKPTTCDLLLGPLVQSICPGSQKNKRKSLIPDLHWELVHVVLKRDPHRGFGFVINEGEDVGQVSPGIFISSVIPGGPAAKTKKIKPGGQILALNRISLEGFTFTMAVRMIQNSPDHIELTISQAKGVCGNAFKKGEDNMAISGISTDILSATHQGSLSSHMQDQDRDSEEQEMVQMQRPIPQQRPQHLPPPVKGVGTSSPPSPLKTNSGEIYFVELAKEDGTLGFSVTGGINTNVLHGGIYVKSIIPGGPAAREGQILQGDRLLQVDGVSLCGLTHRQAVQYLKGPGKVVRLVLERRSPGTAQQHPSPNDRMGDEHEAVSLVTALPGRLSSCVSVTDGPKFEVRLKKNANGLGFSFVQVERATCSLLQSDLVRIKRLFPGQPAEEHGAIEAGDIILAVNGRPTEGLVFQEVLNLLRGPPQEVTLLLCRPPPGVLPEMEPGWQAQMNKEFTRATCTDSEKSPSLDQEDSWRDSTSPDAGEGLALGEAPGGQDKDRPWARSLALPLDSHPHLCQHHQETKVPPLGSPLEEDMRQNCYSVCDIRRLGRDCGEEDTCYPPEAFCLTWEVKEYLTIRCTSKDQLPCGECLEVDSGTIPLPQFCSGHACPESWPLEASQGSESEWEDLEEPEDTVMTPTGEHRVQAILLGQDLRVSE